MSRWKMIKLIYQLQTPLRIGRTSRGFILQTRHYIPGLAMWGAITNKIGNTIPSKDYTPYRHFRDIGSEFMNKTIFTSYFYPAIKCNGDYRLIKPEYHDEEGLHYTWINNNIIQKEEFESTFISSITQTAINQASNSAEDGSLHETEFIKNSIQLEPNKKQNVYFIGYLFYRADTLNDLSNVIIRENALDLKAVLSELVVGGDRKYGYGLMKLNEMQEVSDTQDNYLFDPQIKLINDESNNPCFEIPIPSNNVPLPAHLIADISGLELKNSIELHGDIEPIVGLQTSNKGPGQEPTKAIFGWVPGTSISLVNNESKSQKDSSILHKTMEKNTETCAKVITQKISLINYGILELADNQSKHTE